MNLGSFMDPEYPIFSTTLCYLEREDAYLEAEYGLTPARLMRLRRMYLE